MAGEKSAGVGFLVLVWAILMVLLAGTIGATFLPLGKLMPAANFGIALVKAILIFWVYMHLREVHGTVRLIAAGAVAWLVIMFALMGSDYLTRGCHGRTELGPVQEEAACP